MSVSLMHITERDPATLDRSLLYDLSLDRSVSSFCVDVKRQKYMMEILSHPLLCREDILYRQSILKDFLADSAFLLRLRDALLQITEIGVEHRRSRAKAMSVIHSGDAGHEYGNTLSLLQLNIQAILAYFDRFQAARAILDRASLASEGLLRLKSRFHELTSAEAKDFLQFLHTLTDLSATDRNAITLTVNEMGKVSRCELLSIGRKEEPSVAKGFFKRIFDKKEKAAAVEETLRSALLSGFSDPLRESILGAAYAEVNDALTGIVRALEEEFGKLSEEIGFYQFGNAYHRAMTQMNLAVCFPEISDTPAMRCEELRDIFLCATTVTPEKIVANDVHFSDTVRGILIRGENNSGKTVYLRSISCAQLMAQAGLPVCAKTATVGIRNGLHTQFASGEKEFDSGNDAGRFEQEVRDVVKIVDALVPNSLVILNETFQTTAYAEGADGLYPILNYINARGCGWILVTHLHDLFRLFCDEGVVKMQTMQGAQQYKLEKLPS